jgi:hypothetical protein
MQKLPENVEQLRDRIDSGGARDKVHAKDPAAAPLGADEEAAGTPVPRAVVQAEALHQNAAAATVPPPGGSDAGRIASLPDPQGALRRRHSPAGWILLALAVSGLAALVVYLLDHSA